MQHSYPHGGRRPSNRCQRLPRTAAAAATVAAILLFATVATAGVGCADPRSQRRLDAIDVGGTWLELGERTPLRVVMTFQGSVNDLLVDISGRTIGADEQAVLDRLNDQAQAQALGQRLRLGEADDAVVVEGAGGENVSFDGGETTSVRVVGPTLPLDGRADGAQARYSLHLDGDDELLRGALVLGVEARVPAPDQIDGAAQDATVLSTRLILQRAPTEEDPATGGQ